MRDTAEVADRDEAPARASTDDALTVDDVVKAYGGVRAVDGMAFRVPGGSFTGLLGPNGAGKTTLISIVSGLIPADAGRCVVLGRDVAASKARVQRVLGVVPQDLAIYPSLSARRNLQYFGSMYGLRGRALRSRVDDALERVGLAERAGRPSAGRLSGGQKRRLNIAAALVHRPRFLILDEPTVGVDPQSRNHIFSTLRELHREGMTVLYTSHYMEEVETLCDRVVIVDHGRVIEQGTLAELTAEHGSAIIRLRLRADDRARAVAFLDALGGVTWAEPEEGALDIAAGGLRDAAALLTRLLRDVVRAPEGCQVLPPSLETIFIGLTGTRLRDDA